MKTIVLVAVLFILTVSSNGIIYGNQPQPATRLALSQIGTQMKSTVAATALAVMMFASGNSIGAPRSASDDNGGEKVPAFIRAYRNKVINVGSVKELSIGFASGKQLLVGSTVVLSEPHADRVRDGNQPWTAFGYLSGEMLVGEEDGVHFPSLKASVFNGQFNDDIDIDVYSRGGDDYDHPGVRQVIGGGSFLGYERLDFSGIDAKGFTASHVHLLGASLGTNPEPVDYLTRPRVIIMAKTATGLNNIGIARLGNFNQDDLRAWAGMGGDFSYVLMHEGSIAITLAGNTKNAWWTEGNDEESYISVDKGNRPTGLVLGLTIRDLRTIGGDIEWQDGTDGSFTAAWNDITLTLSQELHDSLSSAVHLQLDGSVYRQTIDASGGGRPHLNSSEKGMHLSAKLQVLFSDLGFFVRPYKNTPAHEITKKAPANGVPYYKYYESIPDDWKKYYPHLKPAKSDE